MAARRYLVTSDAAGLRTHDHTAWCGEGPATLHRLATSVFNTARERNDLMLLVGDEPRLDWLTGIVDVDQLIGRGALRLSQVQDVYPTPLDPAAQLAVFEATLEMALADGYSGVTVVADNSRLVAAGHEEFAAWLAWEALADQLQATRPITGVCYFDLRKVSGRRMVELAAMHPVRCAQFPQPDFQVFCDADALRVIGDLEGIHRDQIRRVVGSAVSATGRELDISELDFMDHNALLTLDEVSRSGAGVRLRGARNIVHRVWQLLDLPKPALEFSS